MDACLSDIWLHKDIEAFAQVFHLILTENVSGKCNLFKKLFITLIVTYAENLIQNVGTTFLFNLFFWSTY